MQADLFLAPPPPPPAADPFPPFDRCGMCCHRNAAVDAPTGYCSPVGWRDPTDPICDQGFSREQLYLSLAKRPKGA